MSKSKQQDRRGERGIPGRPGPRGKQGATGKTGKTGSVGKLGARGAAGKTGNTGTFLPADRLEILSVVQGQIGEVSRELMAQMKRLQSLAGELNELRANVKSLMDSSN